MIRSSSYGGMIDRPRSAAIASARARRSSDGRSDDDDLGALGGDALALDRRGVIGHDDDGRCAQQPCRPGDALAVIADE